MAALSSAPPLHGIRVVELAGLAPGPFATLLLASLGASVLRIDRPAPAPGFPDLLAGPTYKSSIALDLKQPLARALLLDLLQQADVLLDPFRHGVLETLDLDPARLRAACPRLVVARLTGFRRDGRYARMAGHDLNYLAVAGVLALLGPAPPAAPAFPANLLADFAGGGLVCALGVLAALLARERTGEGQVVEASMVDGVSALATLLRLLRRTPLGDRPRGENLLDGGAPWYGVYATRDGRHVAVGALEPQFFQALLAGLDLPADLVQTRADREQWPRLRSVLETRFREKTRGEWEVVFEGTDACVTPVLELDELEAEGYEQRPPVRLSATPLREDWPAWRSEGLAVGEGGKELLEEWMGWKEGREYEVVKGALMKKETAKL